MAIVQKEYRSRMRPTPERQTIWLLADLPQLQAEPEKLEPLREALEAEARTVLREKLTEMFRGAGPFDFNVSAGLTDTKKLELFERVR